MNLRPASTPPSSSKPSRAPRPPDRYFSARFLASPVITLGWITLVIFGFLARCLATASALAQCTRMRAVRRRRHRAHPERADRRRLELLRLPPYGEADQ